MKIRNIISCIVIILFLPGCSRQDMPESPIGTSQTSAVTTSTSSTPEPTMLSAKIDALNEQYKDIFYDENQVVDEEYRNSDYFTTYKEETNISGDRSIVSMEVFFQTSVDVVARVRILRNNGGFNVYERWPLSGYENESTIWSSYDAEIIESHAGNETSGTIIEINFLGGIYENKLHDYNGIFEEFEVGSEYLVFLCDIEKDERLWIDNTNSKLKVYDIWYPMDGYYKIAGDKLSISKNKQSFSHFRTNIDVVTMIEYATELFRLVKSS